MKTDVIETHGIRKDTTDLISRDQIVDRIYSLLSEPPLNIGRNDYCYVKIVGNHLEIGRAKIILEE